MIPVRIAMVAALVACWDGWRLLVGRIDDGTTAGLLLLLAGALGWRFRIVGERDMPATPVAAALMGYTAACVTGPALIQIGAAVGVVGLIALRGIAVPRLPAAGLAALLLPILPTLDFLLAYPLRRVSAAITVALLRSNGVEVTLDGVALEWRGHALLFDGPCSGVRMLWAALVLVSMIALVRQHRPLAYLRNLVVATGIAVVGNALRAASLFYVENGYVARLQGPVAHEAVGILAFALVAAAVIAMPRLQGRRA